LAERRLRSSTRPETRQERLPPFKQSSPLPKEWARLKVDDDIVHPPPEKQKWPNVSPVGVALGSLERGASSVSSLSDHDSNYEVRPK
ncbi:hypothetical protein AVEN_170959-1, partial [Araneus ventricosus]